MSQDTSPSEKWCSQAPAVVFAKIFVSEDVEANKTRKDLLDASMVQLSPLSAARTNATSFRCEQNTSLHFANVSLIFVTENTTAWTVAQKDAMSGRRASLLCDYPSIYLCTFALMITTFTTDRALETKDMSLSLCLSVWLALSVALSLLAYHQRLP